MLQVEAYSSIGGRSKNEDCVTGTHMGKRMCFLVADGLGGHGDGDIASRAAIDTVCGAWNGTISAAEWQRLLELAHAQIQRLQTPQKQMKTTLVGLMLDTEHAVWAHIGDSRLYHFLDGRLVFQTQDHSASQIAVLLGEIAPSQIRSSKDRAILTKALGQPGDVPAAQIHAQLLEPGRTRVPAVYGWLLGIRAGGRNGAGSPACAQRKAMAGENAPAAAGESPGRSG